MMKPITNSYYNNNILGAQGKIDRFFGRHMTAIITVVAIGLLLIGAV